jgi:hypothetical protein
LATADHREAVDDLDLKRGVLAVAVIKSTSVVVAVPAVAVHRPHEGGDSPNR